MNEMPANSSLNPPRLLSRSRDLWPRLGTCLVIGPLAVAALLKLGATSLSIFGAAIMSLLYFEWARACAPGRPVRVWFALALVCALLAAQHVLPVDLLSIYMTLGAALWLAAPWWIRHPAVGWGGTRAMMSAKCALGAVAVVAAVAAFQWFLTFPRGRYLILYVLAVVSAVDTMAYLVGRNCGGFVQARLIAPCVNATKNVGVLACAVLAGLLVAGAGAAIAQPTLGWARVQFFAVGVVVICMGVVGDLISSLIKRQAGIKDSGALLPGHGGVLDRLDSLLAALPAAAVAFRWLSIDL